MTVVGEGRSERVLGSRIDRTSGPPGRLSRLLIARIYEQHSSRRTNSIEWRASMISALTQLGENAQTPQR